ncbi:MAG: hypothetical protein ACT6R7_16875 [Brevundimonas aurantiaca]|jgi:hypothetical protein|uniref:hypothetical protein n=1 Tax=Brevundimonas aurantiaca TaxID=74316 RepID=UPI0040349575
MAYLVEFHMGPEPAHPEWTHFATRADLSPPPIGTPCSVNTDRPLRGLEEGEPVTGYVERLEYLEQAGSHIYRVMLSPGPR